MKVAIVCPFNIDRLTGSPKRAKTSIRAASRVAEVFSVSASGTPDVAVRAVQTGKVGLFSFTKAAMVELATKFDLDGVQFDYIRYPIYSVDYSPAARRRFKEDTGRSVKNWPSGVRKGKLAAEYQRWKQNVITDLVKKVSRSVRTANSDIEISAAVWNDPDIGCDEFGQDWPRWVKNGYLDFVCPMSYTTSEIALRKWTRKQKREVDGKVPIYPGLGVYMMSKPSQLNQQLRVIREEGMPGYVLYNFTPRTLDRFFPYINND